MQQFLRFQLSLNLMALIEIDLVNELVNIPIDKVVPMPHLPPAVMGVYNWRGEILWIVDLAILLGVKASPPSSRSLQPTMILTSRLTNENRAQKTIGFIVDQIAEIEWFDLDLIDDTVSTDIDPEMSRWVNGLLSAAEGEKFLVLDGQSIVNQANFHADI